MSRLVISGPGPFLKLKISQISNGTLLIAKLDKTVVGNISHFEINKTDYDDHGALLYVVAVICIYGLSILLLIASGVKKNDNDRGLRKYMNDYDKMLKLEKRQEKVKARLAMQQRSLRLFAPPIKEVSSVTSILESPNEFNKTMTSRSYASTDSISSGRGSPCSSDEHLLLLAPSSGDQVEESPDMTQQHPDDTCFTIHITPSAGIGDTSSDKVTKKKVNECSIEMDIQMISSLSGSPNSLQRDIQEDMV